MQNSGAKFLPVDAETGNDATAASQPTDAKSDGCLWGRNLARYLMVSDGSDLLSEGGADASTRMQRA